MGNSLVVPRPGGDEAVNGGRWTLQHGLNKMESKHEFLRGRYIYIEIYIIYIYIWIYIIIYLYL